MGRIFSFRATTCMSEYPMYIVSVHKTKVGAYRAMRKWLLDAWNDFGYEW